MSEIPKIETSQYTNGTNFQRFALDQIQGLMYEHTRFHVYVRETLDWNDETGIIAMAARTEIYLRYLCIFGWGRMRRVQAAKRALAKAFP